MDRRPLHSNCNMRPEQVEHLISDVLVSAPDTLKKQNLPGACQVTSRQNVVPRGPPRLVDNQLLNKQQTMGKLTRLHKQLQETTVS